jgi:hypothetical protein
MEDLSEGIVVQMIFVIAGGDLDHDSHERNEKRERATLILGVQPSLFVVFAFFRPLRGPNCLTLFVAAHLFRNFSINWGQECRLRQ